MSSQIAGSDGLVKCPSCGRRVKELFKLTADDIQRRYSPEEVGVFFWQGCADCREKVRDMARMKVNYGVSNVLRDSLITLPTLFAAFFVVTKIWTSSAFFVTTVIFLTTLFTVVREIGGRYALTHNLVWSMRDRRVTVGLSVLVAAVLAIVIPI